MSKAQSPSVTGYGTKTEYNNVSGKGQPKL